MTAEDVLRRRIQQILAERTLTAADLNRLMDRSGSWATQMLAGKWSIPIKELDKLAAKLEVSVGSLFDEQLLTQEPQGATPNPVTPDAGASSSSGPKKTGDSFDSASRGERGDRPRGTAKMAGREQDDQLKRQIIGAYESLLGFPREIRQQFARRVTLLVGEVTREATPAGKGKKVRG